MNELRALHISVSVSALLPGALGRDRFLLPVLLVLCVYCSHGSFWSDDDVERDENIFSERKMKSQTLFTGGRMNELKKVFYIFFP